MLEAVQRARLGGLLHVGERGELHEFSTGAAHVKILELRGIQPLGAADLRDNFVAAALDAEAVHKIAAEHGAEIRADLLKVHAERRDLVAIEHHLGPRHVVFQIRIGKHEHAARVCLGHELVRKPEQLARLGSGGDHKLQRELSAARKRRRRGRDDAHAGNRAELSERLGEDLLGGPFPLAPRLHAHAGNSAKWLRELEGVPCLRNRTEGFVHLVHVERGLLDRGIWRSLHDAEDHALILLRREFARREHEERHAEQNHDRRQRECDGPPAERVGKRAHVAPAQSVETAVHPACEAAVRIALAQELRGHHRRKRERDDAGHDHRARERERELAEQRASEPALHADRRIDCGERDRHRDDRADQFASAADCRLERAEPLVQVSLHIFHDDDRIIHDEPDGKHDGEQREQVQREAEREHEERRAHE